MPGFTQGQSVLVRVPPGHVRQPHVIIVCEVEHRAIHIEHQCLALLEFCFGIECHCFILRAPLGDWNFICISRNLSSP